MLAYSQRNPCPAQASAAAAPVTMLPPAVAPRPSGAAGPVQPLIPTSLRLRESPFVELCLAWAAKRAEALTNSEGTRRDVEKAVKKRVEPPPAWHADPALPKTERQVETELIGNTTGTTTGSAVNQTVRERFDGGRLAPRDGHRSEHATGEFRRSDFLQAVNQGGNLGDASSLVTGTRRHPIVADRSSINGSRYSPTDRV